MAEMTIVVEYDIAEGSEEAFKALISEHAAATLREEPGCLRFDVLKPVGADGEPLANKLMLVEIYADEEAVAAHRANPRMPSVREAVRPHLKSDRLVLAHSLREKADEQGIRPENLSAANDD